jgi:hypothetical protein
MFALYNVLFTNDVCISYIYDCFEEVDKAGLRKGRVKYRLSNLADEVRKYNRAITTILKENEFIADVNEDVEDLLKADLCRLELTTKNYMNKCHVPYTDLQCKCAMAYIFAQGACRNVDENMKINEHISRFTNSLKLLRLTSLLQALTKAMDELEKIFNAKAYFCDMNKNEDIYNGFVIVVRKLADPNFILQILNKNDIKK